MQIARFLSVALSGYKPKNEEKASEKRALAEHTDPKRFRGTQVYLRSPTVSPDYEFAATIDYTENNGADVWLKWVDTTGKSVSYKLRPDDEISVIRLRDAEALRVTPATPQAVAAIEAARAERKPEPQDDRSPIIRLSNYLRKNDIGNRIVGDRIMVVMGKYYIDFVGDGFEFGDTKHGVMARFQNSKEGVRRIVKRIEKIESELDYEKILERVA